MWIQNVNHKYVQILRYFHFNIKNRTIFLVLLLMNVNGITINVIIKTVKALLLDIYVMEILVDLIIINALPVLNNIVINCLWV